MRCFAALIIITITIPSRAQWDSADYAGTDTTQVLYTPGLDLRDGIYFAFEDFRANRPAVELKDLQSDQGRPVADLRQSNGRLFHTDSTGAWQRIDLDALWGFCDHHVVYVRSGDGFNRIGLMGSIAHLVYEVTYHDWGWSDPMYGGPSTNTVQEQRFLT